MKDALNTILLKRVYEEFKDPDSPLFGCSVAAIEYGEVRVQLDMAGPSVGAVYNRLVALQDECKNELGLP